MKTFTDYGMIMCECLFVCEETVQATKGFRLRMYCGQFIALATITVTPMGNQTTYSYDELDRLEETLDPMGKVTAYEYDKVGNVTNVTVCKWYLTPLWSSI